MLTLIVLVFEDYDLIVIQWWQIYNDTTIKSLYKGQFLVGAQETDGPHRFLGFKIDANAGNWNRHVHRVSALPGIVIQTDPFEFALSAGALVDFHQWWCRDERTSLKPQYIVDDAQQ